MGVSVDGGAVAGYQRHRIADQPDCGLLIASGMQRGGSTTEPRSTHMAGRAGMVLLAFVFSALASTPAWAQAAGGIAGVVKDSSGAVLPGVTIEAASPALIEKVRNVVTDGEGQYKIVD